jgi:hypothetical protein
LIVNRDVLDAMVSKRRVDTVVGYVHTPPFGRERGERKGKGGDDVPRSQHDSEYIMEA